MKTKTMWMAVALVAMAWTPAASADGNCTNYGVQVDVTVGDKDCSYEEGDNFYQYCHQGTGSGAAAGAAAVGPGSGDPNASAGASAGSDCTQTTTKNETDERRGGGPGGQTDDGTTLSSDEQLALPWRLGWKDGSPVDGGL